MITDEEIESGILLKLYKRGNWGGSHTSFENLKKGFKREELGKKGLKRIDVIGKKLIREGLLLQKPTHYEVQVSLNPRYHKRIYNAIKRFFEI